MQIAFLSSDDCEAVDQLSLRRKYFYWLCNWPTENIISISTSDDEAPLNFVFKILRIPICRDKLKAF